MLNTINLTSLWGRPKTDSSTRLAVVRQHVIVVVDSSAP